MVWALAVTETISYGVLYYAFAAFLLPMQQGLGYGQTTLAGAFSLSVLLTGAGAVPAGAWLDRHGARALMTAGSLLAVGCVLAWSRAGSVLALYLAFAGIGLAGAAVLYEPAFATVNAYFDTQRQNALLILAAVQAATAIPHFLFLRRRPADQGWNRDGTARIPLTPRPPPRPDTAAAASPSAVERVRLADAVRGRPVVLLTAGAVLGSTAIAAVAVLLLAYLRQRGYPLTVAAAATGALGVMQVTGRVALTVSARRLPIAIATALMLGAQVIGVAALLLIPGLTGVILFVLLFGLGFGVLHIARPDLLARYAPRRLYARISGIQALLVIIGEAATPTGAAALRSATGSYFLVFTAVAACSLAAALMFLAAERASHHQSLGSKSPAQVDNLDGTSGPYLGPPEITQEKVRYLARLVHIFRDFRARS